MKISKKAWLRKRLGSIIFPVLGFFYLWLVIPNKEPLSFALMILALLAWGLYVDYTHRFDP
jgi:hypothetical protein